MLNVIAHMILNETDEEVVAGILERLRDEWNAETNRLVASLEKTNTRLSEKNTELKAERDFYKSQFEQATEAKVYDGFSAR